MKQEQIVLSAVACNLDTAILQTLLPLFENEKIDAVEWSFDALFRQQNTPDWFTDLLQEFAKQKRLVGHGVFFSLFSGKWAAAQTDWLKELELLCKKIHFDHITEHFGFMTGRDFHSGAPLSVPFTPKTLRLGIDRVQRIQAASNCPMGLENLAFAYSVEEVKLHGAFLQQLLAPVNGFIILDLHNLYCQLHNFQVDFEEIVAYYPLEMVREIHISGGTWDEQPALFSLKIRRDTHDDAVPATVFELLKKTLPRCPNVKYVVLEQLGTALQTTIEQENYRNDFDKMRQIVKNFNKTNQKAPKWHDFLPFGNTALSDEPIEDALLHAEQLTLSAILENATSIEQATEALQKSSLRNSAWKIESWQPYMLQTAIDIAQKWKAKAYELK